jgi:prepilin-type N-terminal cleavage/methylation domain-containing protein
VSVKNKGVTLVELLIVIVVIGIIGTFSVIMVNDIVHNTRVEVDSYNIAVLNDLSEKYAEYEQINSGDIFAGFSTDAERMNELVNKQLLSKVITPQQNGATIEWNVDNQEWDLIGGELSTTYTNNPSSYQFTTSTLTDIQDQGTVSIDIDDWSYNEDGYIENSTGETRLFIPIHKITYTITATAALSAGTAGGYGVFFDTYLENDNEDRDYGYIIQFDRGYSNGSMVVRPRSNGSEGGPVWVLKASDSDVFPTRQEDSNWWTDTHTIKIVVSNINTTSRSAKFYIDNQYLGEYTYTNAIEGKQIYTGFRGWGTATTKFYGISID